MLLKRIIKISLGNAAFHIIVVQFMNVHEVDYELTAYGEEFLLWMTQFIRGRILCKVNEILDC